MEYLEQSIKFFDVTPEMASKWLANCNFDNQRNTRSWWVDYLAKEMLADRFEAVATITFATTADTKTYYNINGRHTLLAIVKSGETVNLPVSSFLVENEQRVKELFARIDKNLKRTTRDSIEILNIDEQMGLNKTETAQLLSAINHIGSRLTIGGNSTKYTESEKLIVLKDFENEYKLFKDSIANDLLKFYKNGMILAIALLMFRFNLDNAVEFWKSVSLGEGRKNSPERELFDYLHFKRNRNSINLRNTIAYCWNQFLLNKSAYLTEKEFQKHFADGFYLRSIDIDFNINIWERQFFNFNCEN